MKVENQQAKRVQYEFTTSTGGKAYEYVECSMDIARACSKHNAIAYKPVNPAERVPMFRTIKEAVQ